MRNGKDAGKTGLQTRPRIRLRISPSFAVVSAAVVFFGLTTEYVLLMMCAAAHEAAHVILSLRFGAGVEEVKLTPAGLFAVIDESALQALPLWKKNAIYIAGPLVSLVLSAVLGNFSYAGRLSQINLVFFAANLLPVLPLDGGRLLLGILAGRVGFVPAVKIVAHAGRIVRSVLFFAGLAQLTLFPPNISLICASEYLRHMGKKASETAVLCFVRDVLTSNKKYRANKVFNVRHAFVHAALPVSKMINILSYDNFIVFYISDGNAPPKKMTEIELLRYTSENGTNGRAGEICRCQQIKT